MCPMQVLNDLLEPSHTNLKLFEDSSRGVVRAFSSKFCFSMSLWALAGPPCP